MHRIILSLFLFLASLLPLEGKDTLLVSTAPYRYFVHQIAGDLFDVMLMVPAGASAHTYEPSPKQTIQASNAQMWFRLGEPFETKAIQAIKSVNPKMVIVDLRQGIPLLHSSCTHAHHGHSCGEDLHLWLSPAIAKIQAQTIANALSEKYKEHAPYFEKQLKNFLNDLDDLNLYIQNKLAGVKNRTLMVSHPAYAYFCKQYGFTQLPIEFEGKDPTSKQLTKLLSDAKNSNVHVIFTQPQYSDKAAQLIAKQIGAKLISVDPYSEDYDKTLRNIANLIAEN